MRFRAFGIGVLLLALAACSGGGGGGGPTVPEPPLTPTPTPSPVPTPPPARPAANGDSFAYAGTLVRTFVRFPEPGVIAPSPVQTNAQSFTSNVAQTVTVSTGVAYAGTPNLTDFKTVESDAQLSPAKTTIVTSDAYASYPSGTSGTVRAIATVAKTSDGVTFLTTFGGDNGLIDVLPETPGPLVPADSAALVTTETDPDGTTTTRRTNADGSYVETSAYPDGTAATATEAADGTGTYSLPLFGIGTSAATPTIPNTKLIVGAVVAAIGLAPSYIPVRIVYAPGLAAATSVTFDRKVPDWYASVPPQPPVLASETYVDNGARPIPGACALPAGSASGGNQLVRTNAKTDVLFGETETLTTTAYVAAAGVVCTQLVDTVAQYYDYTGQTVRPIATFGTPLQTTTVSETLGLSGETLLGGARRTDFERGGTNAATRVTNVGLLQSFIASLERRRLERHAAALRALRFAGAR